MRVHFIASALLLTALAGCAEMPQMELAEMQPYPEASYAPNETAAAAPIAEPEGPTVPVVTAVATTPYTAPEPIELAVSDEGAHLALVAGPDGLSCVSTPHQDPFAAPAGYKVVAVHAACRLIADNETFVEARADDAAVDLPLMSEIPVEEFLFEMELSRTLVNNTGSHEDIIASYTTPVSAAPSGWLEPNLPYGLWYGEVCDAPDSREAQTGPEGVETITFTAFGHNGRPSIVFDATGFDVVDVQGGNMTNGTIVAVGEWAHESVLELHVTIDFESAGERASLIPGCDGTAFQVDYQYLHATAVTEGIAAGWQDVHEAKALVKVFLKLV